MSTIKTVEEQLFCALRVEVDKFKDKFKKS